MLNTELSGESGESIRDASRREGRGDRQCLKEGMEHRNPKEMEDDETRVCIVTA